MIYQYYLLQYTVLHRSGLSLYGTNPSFTLRNQNRLPQQRVVRHQLNSISLNNELDPSDDILPIREDIALHQKKRLLPAEHASLAIHQSSHLIARCNETTPVQSYRTPVLIGASSR